MSKGIVDPDPIERFLDFICERENVRRRRAKGKPPPWTDDPLLRDGRFTNVRREHDRVTQWIAKHWREPHADDPDLWFAMVVARFVNWPDTLAQIGYPVPWRPDHFLQVMAARKAGRQTCYNIAYTIHADNRRDQKYLDVPSYQVAEVFDPLWRARERLRPKEGDTLARWFARLSECHGLGGGFMPAQIIADMKQVEPLKHADDWWTFAVSGPGSRRGLNRIMRRPEKAKWHEADWQRELRALHKEIAPDLVEMGIGQLCAQDLQNCLCEFSKYERKRLGEREFKRRFRPSDDQGDKRGLLF
jgi:hypothetical protein